MKDDSELTFVNIFGETISKEALEAKPRKRKAKLQPEAYHNGWRVQGIPPGALDDARHLHQVNAAMLRDAGKEPEEWNEEHWLMNAKRKAVRSKPYEVPQAAQECRAMAERAGWLRVEIVELKKEASVA